MPRVRFTLSALVLATAACAAPADTVPSISADTERSTVAATTTAPDPIAIGANELGAVPVLMYHQLSPAPSSEYDQTPDEFRAELERLYRSGYRPVTAADYVSGKIDLPAGTHPVILTFDDSSLSQLHFTEDGRPAADSAIGILEEFGAHNPGFARATLYVNNEPFGNDPRALPWLAAHGYEIGSHTASHPNLASLDGTEVQREFAENVRAIEAAAPGTAVRTMALPLGIAPADPALATAGAWSGIPYRFDAVMLVGAGPAPSPYGDIDAAGIPRIRSGKGEVPFDSAYWLSWLDENPAERYTSDGVVEKISFPAVRSGELGTAWSTRANAY